jgi:hypothetical protein
MLDAEVMMDNGYPQGPCSDTAQVDNALQLDGIHFKADRMYRHHVMRINYTTYDVRRAQDTINPKTDHCDVMLLSGQGPGSHTHQYIYARVLGIFHVNVIYAGPGMRDYKARRMEFLWVRWFELVDNISVQQSWANRHLDRLQFPPMSDDEAFGFIDPSHVLRACHVIPRFAIGLRHVDGRGISECAQNTKDWFQYYIAR